MSLKKEGILYIVATPIGNLNDITFRAVNTLKQTDIIFAEDTRVTSKLLNHLNIKKPIKTLHQHSKEKIFIYIISLLKKGLNVSYCSDSGTPGIADPGEGLISYIRNNEPKINIETIPGPSALTSAYSIAGFESNRFTFLGFPPNKKGRMTFFDNLKKVKIRPIIIYESPYRLIKTLKQIEDNLGEKTEIFVVGELTKMFEKQFFGEISKVIEKIKNKGKVKGEYVIIINK